MGWLFGHSSRSGLIQDLTKDQETDYAYWHTVAKYCSGNTMWAVQEITSKDTGKTERFIACFLLARHGNGLCSWGYKDMCEQAGPYEVSCPPKFLDMVPEVADQEWRDRVLAYWKARRDGGRLAKSIKHGQTFRSKRSGDLFEFSHSKGGYVIGALLEANVPKPPMFRSKPPIVGQWYRVRSQDVEIIEAQAPVGPC